MRRFSLIIPSIPEDVQILLHNIDTIFSFLPVNRLVLIGSHLLKDTIPDDNRIEFIHENDLIDVNQIKNLIDSHINKPTGKSRAGWYIQQFLKMAYSKICKEDYYLLWDSDTIPTHPISLFDENDNPIFDCKVEYHKPYFETIEQLFPGLKKQIEGSFISEHMLIRTSFMCQIISKIESNGRIAGKTFGEKIINSISSDDLQISGFSEFETYGSYVHSLYPNFYTIRKWKSMRFGGFFFPLGDIGNEDLEWLSKNYDAISFEKIHQLSTISVIVNSIFFKKFFSSSVLQFLSLPIRLKRRYLRK